MPPLPRSILRLTKEDDLLQKRLLETYNPSLPQPEPPSKNHSETVIVWRGCRADQLVKVAQKSTAGGAFLNAEVSAPSEKEALGQIGESASLPEFTLSTAVAERFGRGNFILACEIHVKYLAQGSVSEKGVICSPQAPINILGWKHGMPLVTR